jgi:hypothetical protein
VFTICEPASQSRAIPPDPAKSASRFSQSARGLISGQHNEHALEIDDATTILGQIPTDFVLETNNKKYDLHFAVMANICGKLESLSPQPSEFHIDLDDPTDIFDKFSRLFRGERVTLIRTEGKFYKRVTEILDIEGSFPA